MEKRLKVVLFFLSLLPFLAKGLLFPATHLDKQGLWGSIVFTVYRS